MAQQIKKVADGVSGVIRKKDRPEQDSKLIKRVGFFSERNWEAASANAVFPQRATGE